MKNRLIALLLCALGAGLAGAAQAAPTAISQTPLLNIKGTGAVKPNVVLLYDDSGSMAFNYTPDIISYNSRISNPTQWQNCRAGANYATTRKVCGMGDPPFTSPDLNKQYYNPSIRYSPPVDATGASYTPSAYGNASPWKTVRDDGFDTSSPTSTNLVTSVPDLKWCNSRNQCVTNTGYRYPDSSYNTATAATSNPYYYRILAAEYCTDASLKICKQVASAAAAAPTGYPVPAPVRWCSDLALTTGTCQAKVDDTHIYPRFSDPNPDSKGVFVRTDIVITRNSYPKDPQRIDCAGSTCTYTEEMTNFANWWTFYRTRNQMMKTAVGQAFAPLNKNFNVGLATLRDADASGTIAAAPQPFEGDSRTAWYRALYAANPSGGTPLRSAVNKVAVAFRKNSWVTAPCQPNYMLVTTDGYWNGAAAKEYNSSNRLLSTDLPNNDATANEDRFCTVSNGCVDRRRQSANETNSLADVALYWYNGGSATGTVSLVPGLEDINAEGQVPGAAGENKHLHINTFTLGLGVDGLMTYDPNYDKGSNSSSDFAKILAGASGCPWNGGGTYVWPDPVTSDANDDHQSRVDDLWHAAVNGHGKYFNASVPRDVVRGLSSALNTIGGAQGAASAAATSTPSISLADNDIFSNTYTTVKWYGELYNQKIDPVSGEVNKEVVWTTSSTLGKRVSSESDNRKIYMRNVDTPRVMKNFDYAGMSAAEKAWFDKRCDVLAQCTMLSDQDKDTAAKGVNLVNWLRGQQKYADDNIYRAYGAYQPDKTVAAVPLVLGDIVSSKPAYVRDPRKAYQIEGYAAYKAKHRPGVEGARKAMVYTAANDGMLHAFDAGTGAEEWAYVPRIVMKKLAAQASTAYGLNHQFTADGSPEVSDVQIGGVWKTVLVAGLGAGGRGYYAIDVTIPTAPVPLWELCADTSVCPLVGANTAAAVGNIGLTLGNVQFGMWNGKWVVYLTSGYNNVPGTDGVNSGDGKGHLFIIDVATGEILRDVSTASGDATTPSGLSKITAISINPNTDPVTTYVYGGDNLGQMWRFDLTDKTNFTVSKILMGSAGASHPISARPEVSSCMAGGAVKRVVVFGTGRLLDVPDTQDKTTVQSLYVLKDEDGAAGNPIADIRGSTMVQQTMRRSGTSNYLISSNDVDLRAKNGWFVDWSLNGGERMNLDPKIVNGGISVVTNVPGESTACSVGGSSNVYQYSVCSGSLPSSDMIVGSTLSNTAAAVGFIVVGLSDGRTKGVATLANGDKKNFDRTPLQSRGARKAGWRRVTR